jgi:hypothetical protein
MDGKECAVIIMNLLVFQSRCINNTKYFILTFVHHTINAKYINRFGNNHLIFRNFAYIKKSFLSFLQENRSLRNRV